MKTTFRRALGYIAGLGLLAAIIISWQQRQAIYDWWRLKDYTPPPAIVKIAQKASFSPTGRHVFYVYHPELDDKQTFGTHCSNRDEQTIVLGCYVVPVGIYLYNVKDPRLEGVVEVTAAHEMLHAAYDRLSDKEKERIDRLINQAYSKITDPRIRTNIANYRKHKADITNELHSILATEVRSLPAELEQYYRQYFTDRLTVVAASEQYEGVFTALKNQAASLASQLTSLKKQITAYEQQLSAQRASLERDRSGVKTQSQANAFNARVNSFNSQVAVLNNLVTQYNSLLASYNRLAVQQQQLFKAIDSRPTAATQ